MVDGMHYNKDCNCKNCKMVTRNMENLNREKCECPCHNVGGKHCPCHQPPATGEDWEKEFDKMFEEDLINPDLIHFAEISKLKFFIKSLLTSQKEKMMAKRIYTVDFNGNDLKEIKCEPTKQ